MLNATRKVHRSPVAGWPGVTVQGHSKSQLQFSKYVPSMCQLMVQLPNYRLRKPLQLIQPRVAITCSDFARADTPRGYSDGNARVRHTQTHSSAPASENRGADQGPAEDGRGRPLLHRRPDPGQRRQGRARKRRPPSPRGSHRALRRRSDPGRRRRRQGQGAQQRSPAAREGIAIVFVLNAIGQALQMAFFMFWEVLWPLALGFLISGIVQTVVSRRTVVGLLGKDDLRGASIATLLGAASSSCSYAAVAVGRGLFRKGATFANAILFEFASTNLVFELGLVLLVLLGWQFVAAEFAGGLLMVAILAVIFKYTLRARMVDVALEQAEKGLRGRMEGHGEMDMSITDGPFFRRLVSPRAFTAISHYFYMDVASLYQDLILGFLIAGALAAWVPNHVWQSLFLSNQPALGAVWGPIVGPIISMLSFVCS